LLPALKKLVPHGILGGGTALALQLGHRISFDLDVFLTDSISSKLFDRIQKVWSDAKPLIDTTDELTLMTQNTKITFLYYPFKSLHKPIECSEITMFDIRDIASSKAYAIGRRGVWRDYADMFMLLQPGQQPLELKKIMIEARRRFGDAFNEKLFLQQLTYWDDISDKKIEWLDKQYSNKTIEKFLMKAVDETIKQLL
jgi:hypothetical protein